MSLLLNDGSSDAPKLKIYLNQDNLTDLPSSSIWPGLTGIDRDTKLSADGFEGIQITGENPPSSDSPLGWCGLDRISTAAEADPVVAKHADRGDPCITVHAGWGLEDEDDMFALVESILRASEKYHLPVFIETHRATITQDLWRTVQITKKFPEVLFNGDFSHFYCGQELPYGGMEMKLAFMEPIFARTGFMHGRIASSGCMQVPIGDWQNERPLMAHGLTNYLEDFKEMWTRAMLGFLRIAGPGDVLIFAPEILSGTYYYARLFPNADGILVEESDRYAEALQYTSLAKSCFAKAQARLKAFKK